MVHHHLTITLFVKLEFNFSIFTVGPHTIQTGIDRFRRLEFLDVDHYWYCHAPSMQTNKVLLLLAVVVTPPVPQFSVVVAFEPLHSRYANLKRYFVASSCCYTPPQSPTVVECCGG